MKVVGASCHISSCNNGIVETPFDNFNGRYTEKNLNNEPDVKCVLHYLFCSLVFARVGGEIISVDAEAHAIREVSQTKADESSPVFHIILYYIKMNN